MPDGSRSWPDDIFAQPGFLRRLAPLPPTLGVVLRETPAELRRRHRSDLGHRVDRCGLTKMEAAGRVRQARTGCGVLIGVRSMNASVPSRLITPAWLPSPVAFNADEA